MADVQADYDSLRARHAGKGERTPRSTSPTRPRRRDPGRLGAATCRRCRAQPGVHVLDDYDLAELREYIDWQPFFNAWEMKGRFPDILNNPTTGEAARKLYDDAQAMLDRIIAEKWLTARGVYGLLPGRRRRRRHRGLRRRRPHRAARRAAPPAPAGRAPRGHPAPVAGRLRRPGRHRPARPRRRRSRSPPGIGLGERVEAVPGRPRRLQRDPARVAGRPARRGVRRAAAPAGAHRVLGSRRRRRALATRT